MNEMTSISSAMSMEIDSSMTSNEAVMACITRMEAGFSGA